MKLVITGYVPPPRFGCADAFLRNFNRLKRSTETILFSDHPYGDMVSIADPEKLTECMLYVCEPGGAVKKDPWTGEKIRRPYAISNAVFHTALRLAVRAGATHMLYIESDCRVNGDYWDERIWTEYFSQPFPPIAAGTLVSFNAANGGLDYVRRWQELITQKSEYPILSYGSHPLKDDPRLPSLFPNGALGVYRVDWLSQFFDLTSLAKCVQRKAWDYEIGMEIYQRFKNQSFDLLAQLNTVCSAYGDALSTEEQRLKWLHDGKFAAVHQVKSNR